MNIGLHSGAHRLHSLERQQQVLATNLANLSTPGYQPQAFVTVGRPIVSSGPASSPQAMLPVSTMARAPEGPAMMRPTGDPYDFGVEGEGYFAVQDDAGRTLYTRDGQFHRDADGVLVNKYGYAVLGEGGAIEIPLEEAGFSVARDGVITANGELVGRMQITAFEEPEALQSLGGGLFMDGGQAGAEQVEDPVVLQGHLEGSHVSPMREMVALIDAARAYELTQKLIEEGDQRAQQAIRAFSE